MKFCKKNDNSISCRFCLKTPFLTIGKFKSVKSALKAKGLFLLIGIFFWVQASANSSLAPPPLISAILEGNPELYSKEVKKLFFESSWEDFAKVFFYRSKKDKNSFWHLMAGADKNRPEHFFAQEMKSWTRALFFTEFTPNSSKIGGVEITNEYLEDIIGGVEITDKYLGSDRIGGIEIFGQSLEDMDIFKLIQNHDIKGLTKEIKKLKAGPAINLLRLTHSKTKGGLSFQQIASQYLTNRELVQTGIINIHKRKKGTKQAPLKFTSEDWPFSQISAPLARAISKRHKFNSHKILISLLNMKNKQGERPLDIAYKSKNLTAYDFLRNFETARRTEKLIENGIEAAVYAGGVFGFGLYPFYTDFTLPPAPLSIFISSVVFSEPMPYLPIDILNHNAVLLASNFLEWLFWSHMAGALSVETMDTCKNLFKRRKIKSEAHQKIGLPNTIAPSAKN